jgi:hypothetical protein
MKKTSFHSLSDRKEEFPWCPSSALSRGLCSLRQYRGFGNILVSHGLITD